ncbi:type VI secretion system contractile sheath small subunit [Chromobacterium haemolyticum]|uniref:type VI secretion system contractile sheath small subunit n=1 Tax=Chromobacterium haemolyticum TaxID=394935 RepID=UPI00237873D3|nr:type VI secretion system contractile sheath small subunit [Chromobacterium haemolyticum]
MKKLLDARKRLADLRNKMAGNDKLEELLDEVVRDTEKLKAISQAAHPDKAGE